MDSSLEDDPVILSAMKIVDMYTKHMNNNRTILELQEVQSMSDLIMKL